MPSGKIFFDLLELLFADLPFGIAYSGYVKGAPAVSAETGAYAVAGSRRKQHPEDQPDDDKRYQEHFKSPHVRSESSRSSQALSSLLRTRRG